MGYYPTSDAMDWVTDDDRGREINGRGGNDRFYSAAGNDVLIGGSGRDTLYGQVGDDALHGGDHGETVSGGAGDDYLHDTGRSQMFGGGGNDTLDASNNNYRGGYLHLYGEDGDDDLRGGDLHDSLFSGRGNDLVDAGYGKDWVDGGDGADTLYGDQYDDTLLGGHGRAFASMLCQFNYRFRRMTMTEPHRWVITWHDPRAHMARVKEMSGIEFLQAIADGDLPQAPIAEAMGFRLAEVAAGRTVFVGTPEGHMMNPMGAIHGGYFGALLDSAMGCAVGTLCAAGQGYTTLEYKINLVRGMTPETGEVRTEGWVVHSGRRTATAEGRITDAAGRLIGHGSTTCVILS